MARVRIAAAQLDVVVGDLDGNARRILAAYERAEDAGCDLVVFPELTVTGYPPEDLLLRPAFVAESLETLDKIAARTGRCVAVVGFAEAARDLFNAAAVCANGTVFGVYRKHLLPNYAVFDEQRYFVPGTDAGPLFTIAGVNVGVSICEDAWSPDGPILSQAAGGAELIVNLNASPYYAGRLRERETMLATRAADASVPIVYANLVGGQDELVFDGASLVFDEQGHLVARAKQFVEDLLTVDLEVRPTFRKRLLDPRGRARAPELATVAISDARPTDTESELAPRLEAVATPVEEVYGALVLQNIDGSGARVLVPGPAGSPAWSPDGKLIAFLHDGHNLAVMSADGSGRRCRPASTLSGPRSPTAAAGAPATRSPSRSSSLRTTGTPRRS